MLSNFNVFLTKSPADYQNALQALSPECTKKFQNILDILHTIFPDANGEKTERTTAAGKKSYSTLSESGNEALSTLLEKTLALPQLQSIPLPENLKTLNDVANGPNTVYAVQGFGWDENRVQIEEEHKIVIISDPKSTMAGELSFSDLHGDLGALYSFLPNLLTHLEAGGITIADGDIFEPVRYEDKSSQLATLVVIFTLMNLFPQQFYYLAGNHEYDDMTPGGVRKFIRLCDNILLPEEHANTIVQIFKELPKVALSKLQNTIYVHAGLPNLPAEPEIADIFENIFTQGTGVIPLSSISFIPNVYKSCSIHQIAEMPDPEHFSLPDNIRTQFAYILTNNSNKLFYWNANALDEIQINPKNFKQLLAELNLPDKLDDNVAHELRLQKISEICHHNHVAAVTDAQLARYELLGATAVIRGHDHLNGDYHKDSISSVSSSKKVFNTFSSSAETDPRPFAVSGSTQQVYRHDMGFSGPGYYMCSHSKPMVQPITMLVNATAIENIVSNHENIQELTTEQVEDILQQKNISMPNNATTGIILTSAALGIVMALIVLFPPSAAIAGMISVIATNMGIASLSVGTLAAALGGVMTGAGILLSGAVVAAVKFGNFLYEKISGKNETDTIVDSERMSLLQTQVTEHIESSQNETNNGKERKQDSAPATRHRTQAHAQYSSSSSNTSGSDYSAF